MNNLVIIPILIPLITGIVLLFFRQQIFWQRTLSMVSFIAMLIVSLFLVHQVSTEGIQTLQLGGWEPPYGIILVADMFAVLLVATTSIVAIACLWYAFNSIGIDRERKYFYALVQFLIVGVSGSFLTGDIFNLFVMFEVMLISSYVLISLGGTKRQLRESIKYVLINIVSSILFVGAVAYLYATTGTLNFAQLSLRVAAAGQPDILTLISLLFMIVFGLKAGLFLYYWLPGSYSAPPTAIAALFGGLLTKVGIYALIRTFTLIFVEQPHITHTILAWLAILTIVLGVIGAVGHSDIRKIIAYNVVAAVGFIVLGLAFFTTTALAGAVFYLIHDMIIKAALFLLGGTMIALAGTSQLRKLGGMIDKHKLLGWSFFIAAIALAGVPPLSGFVGKLLIVQGGLEYGSENMLFFWMVIVSLLTSLLILYSVMKIFMSGFWGENKENNPYEGNTKGLLAPCVLLIALSIAIGLGAEQIMIYVNQAAETLMNPSIYIDAVNVKE